MRAIRKKNIYFFSRKLKRNSTGSRWRNEKEAKLKIKKRSLNSRS